MRISDWSSDVCASDLADQRQADQRSGIGGFDRVEQTDAVAFAFEAAGAVQCRFDFDVTCNFFVAELAKSHRGDVQRVQHLLAMNQRDGCQDANFATRAGARLGMRLVDIAGPHTQLLEIGRASSREQGRQYWWIRG